MIWLLDEDNDKVALSTDPELEVIWLETKSSGQQLRLYIHVIWLNVTYDSTRNTNNFLTRSTVMIILLK